MPGLLVFILLVWADAALAAKTNITSLHPRFLAMDQSCMRPIPGDPAHRTYNDKVKKALLDAENLVGLVSNDMTKFKRSTAFSHYFRASQVNRVARVYDSISHIFSPTALRIPYVCGDDQDSMCRGCDHAIAFTNRAPNEGTIVFCDFFFKDFSATPESEAHPDLDSKSTYDWCHQGKLEPWNFFNIAAVTVIHKITHLNAIGVHAGLFPRIPLNGQHGTRDVEDLGSNDDLMHLGTHKYAWKYARTLKKLWDNRAVNRNAEPPAYRPLLKTYENAENYAAAAIEYYFLCMCGYEEVLPEFGMD